MIENPQVKKQQKRLAQNQKQLNKQKKEVKRSSKTQSIKQNKKRNIPQSAQQTLPYRRILPDGICQVDNKKYTKTIRFYDINYLLAQNEDKSLIFENYCDFLNYFDSSINFQLSFINQSGNTESFIDSIQIQEQDDDFNDIRLEYSNMLKNQLSKGNNGLLKTKYITFGIEADSLKLAKPRLERIESDILNNFKVMGVKAYSLNGKERVELLHSICHQDTKEKLNFTWDLVKSGGVSTKDIIVPTSFNFSDPRRFKMGETIGAISFLQILAPELTDRMLADFLDLEDDIIVNFHIQSIDQTEAIKNVKRKITDLDRMKIEEQKKAVRAGYDMDIIPSDLATFGNEAKSLLEDLQNRNERMFLVTIIVLNTAMKKQKLENIIFQTGGIAQKYNCALRKLDYQQENGFISSLPLGENYLEISRGLTTSSTAIFIPFTTQELFMDGESLYYGLNALSNNMIMVDRKKLKNPNGLILGTPGSGKSFSAKREITNAFLITDDDIIICDPEAEYYPLVNKLNGQVIKISPTSPHYINPMDLNLDYSDDENPLSLKSDFILSLCELIVGGKHGLEPVEKTIIDRCVRLVYQDFLSDSRMENMPILEDLYNLFREQEEAEAKRLATALEIYVTGSLNVFNHHTNVDVNNRLVCYDIKELGKQLKKIGMLIVQDQVWNRVTINRTEKRNTRYYVDEFHLLLKEEQTAAYSVEIWKRFRKWGGMPTGITQNIKDLLSSREIENIFENSDFIYMLNQAAGDRQILAKQLNISPHQLSYVTNSNEGEGLLFYGNVIIPFVDKFPKDTLLYSIMTTKPEEVQGEEGV
ncbi:Type IV secretory pathway, VirB4 component [Sporanaerobacter acetigenes DSM 13106]|uniref:Type IV secretory pathway, VirB4 component n=1 Tax=Sporanaerobacter acetigenes DSM 13106 TaxID=1123281 RepID=A0A1M5YG37_9FIRM|nr:Type IV secretory pathway, VirB4 component [Sporanaerobacter acetigenes DSM 13106]